ncbi:MAG TPA: hypothetical protein VG054_02005, partial [Acidimicrobiales bacterium]|nr:hypothetical protein [Acidimicrobiales bacterium]
MSSGEAGIMHSSAREEASDSPPMRVGVIGTGFGSRVVAGAFRDSGCEVTDVVTARDGAAV